MPAGVISVALDMVFPCTVAVRSIRTASGNRHIVLTVTGTSPVGRF